METPGIGSWLTRRELLTPAKEAVVDGQRRLNYQQLNRRVNRLARALQGLGLQFGDRIGILSYNCMEFVEVIMAAAKLGLILVPLNWRLTPVELIFNLNDSGAETLFFDSELVETVTGIKGNSLLKQFIVFGTKETMEARAYEPPTGRTNKEFSRKVRIINRGLRGVILRKKLLNPFRYGFYSLTLFSHKLARRLVPVFLVLLFVSNFFLIDEHILYLVTLLLQAGFYSWAVVSFLLKDKKIGQLKIAYLPFFFCMANLAALVSLFNLIIGKRVERWNPQR